MNQRDLPSRLLSAFAVLSWAQIGLRGCASAGIFGWIVGAVLGTAGLVALERWVEHSDTLGRLGTQSLKAWCITVPSAYVVAFMLASVLQVDHLPGFLMRLFGMDADVIDVLPTLILVLVLGSAIWQVRRAGPVRWVGTLVFGALAVGAAIVAVRIPEGADERAILWFSALALPLVFALTWSVLMRFGRTPMYPQAAHRRSL